MVAVGPATTLMRIDAAGKVARGAAAGVARRT